MNNQRFNYLLEAYRKGAISQVEYKELIWMLGEPDMEEELEPQLTGYWHKEQETKNDESASSPEILMETGRKKSYRYLGIAASVVLLLGLFYYLWGVPHIFGPQEKTYSTGFGERLEIELDDGSRITLNAHSTLKWKDGWEKKGAREAVLDGEAFFKVKRQNGMPFTVHTSDVSVEVLGTSFNIDNREATTKVYLDEGKVNLKLNAETNNNNLPQEMIMKPGDQISYSAQKKKIEKTEGQTMITAAAWKMNVLNFKNMQFREVLDLLAEIYGQSFECKDSSLLRTPMYLGVPYSDWEAVKQALELSLNIRFQETRSQHYRVLMQQD